jgi:hypothetical protein
MARLFGHVRMAALTSAMPGHRGAHLLHCRVADGRGDLGQRQVAQGDLRAFGTPRFP